MKRFYYILFLSVVALACSKQNEVGTDIETDMPCGKYKSGQQLYKGSKGGCYYYNSKDKEYVERDACKC
jgi:hypothetical protein